MRHKPTYLFLFALILLASSCDKTLTWEQSIVNQSDQDLTFQFYGLLSPIPADSFTVLTGTAYILEDFEGDGRLGELPECQVLADSVSITMRDTGKVLVLDILDGQDWELTLVEGADGGGSKRCTFQIQDNDIQ